jgi:hypothetical protein
MQNLDIRHVEVRYADALAVRELSIDIAEGEFVSLSRTLRMREDISSSCDCWVRVP